jgi:hypothetical protein
MTDETSTADTTSHDTTPRRKLKVLVITMGGERQAHIQAMFASSLPHDEVDPPAFSPGVPSRDLRNRYRFLYHAHLAGLLPEAEWHAIRTTHGHVDDASRPMSPPPPPPSTTRSDAFFDCLNDIPVTTTPHGRRRGSQDDRKLHYSVELWRKARGVNRGRAVLACLLAHLIAMRRSVRDDFDVIVEDNVRMAIDGASSWARRVWETKRARQEWEEEHNRRCHHLYLGWLGSITNLRWILEIHAPKRKFARKNDNNKDDLPTIFPFPCQEHLEEDLAEWEDNYEEDDQNVAENEPEDDTPQKYQHKRPGGNPVWGAYAYWISKQGYEQLMESLRNDVGAMLWKGKRMRHYLVKPVDKILPRQTMALSGPSSVQLATHPAFFRAPMLTSKIHTQWDPEFCRSTEYQLRACGGSDDSGRSEWSSLWLSPLEREIVQHHTQTGEWLTIAELHQKDNAND